MFLKEKILRGGEALKASVGTVLAGRYRVRSTLGTGGMAVVYKAEDAILGRCVALKTLHRRYAEEPSFRSRFKQEARVMASLDHENIVKVYDICQDGEVPFIVAEYIDGQDVGEVLKGAPKGYLGEQFTKKIAEQLLGALAYAHEHGVIHRDVKPSNILITGDEVVKVADFGIARVVEAEEVGKPGEIIGSARYMSPEQLKGEETTPQSDLYSAGILLYHCLTGNPPFSGDAGSVARQQIHKAPTPPRRLNKAISPHLEAVILRALAKDPGGRYPSASAMLEDLQGDAGDTSLAEATGLGRRRRKRKRHARKPLGDRKALLVSSMLVLLLLGAGTAVAGLAGRVGLGADPPLPWLVEEALVPSQPAAEEEPAEEEPAEAPGVAPEISEEVVPIEETPVEEPAEETPVGETPAEEAPAPEPSPEDSQTAALVPVPSVDAYFDYFAAQTLQDSGFRPQLVYGYREGYATRGVAWGTDPAAGTPMPLGSTITIYVTPKDQPQIQSQPQIQPPQP
ncbi:MAG: protein kinase, partial [Actinomycetota bacterium]|nr:protein kinase [Actinomycetota bacterium]